MKKHIMLIIIFCTYLRGRASEKKQLIAVRINEPPKIDGVLDDASWKNVPVATDFTTFSPDPGKSAYQKTEVKVVYDNDALYIGAMMYDTPPDSILHELSKRDHIPNTDWFVVLLDTYNDDINAFQIGVNASGVQHDAKLSSNGQDFSWNAVWQSAVKIADNGWVAEFKIPYSAIRFPKGGIQNWGINFARDIRRKIEDSSWDTIDPSVQGVVIQSGDLAGVTDIKPPLRLSLTPYASSYLENYPYNQPGKSNNSYSLNGGLDLKYGMSQSFTMDITLIPDFGQVQSDNKVLNLSPFEVKYNENRSFFKEGTELFNQGQLFYSRRIGGLPIGYYNVYNGLQAGETVIKNPAETQLINSTKISGRTSGNLGMGFLNATTASSYAVISETDGTKRTVLTQPLTNYNVTVFDQALKHNSYIRLFNTNVLREGNTYDANVTGTKLKFANKKNTYSIQGGGSISQKNYRGSSNIGSEYWGGINKTSGNLSFGLGVEVKNNTYDRNDLGILYYNNYSLGNAEVSYNIYKPFWKVNNLYINIGISYSRLYSPNAFWTFDINDSANTTFTKQFLAAGFNFSIMPVVTYDYFEPRVAGRYYAYPDNVDCGGYISSDYRKKFAIDISAGGRNFNENNRHNYYYGISPRYRLNNQLSFIYSFKQDYSIDDIGFVNLTNNTITFGRRDVKTITNTLTGNYIFNNKMSLSFRLRHYWSEAEYKGYYTLNNLGHLEKSNYSTNHNIGFNAFNIDLVYRWQFSPGSEISIVWKNAILNQDSQLLKSYFDNLNKTIDSPQTNSFSFKLLYYLDYQMLKKRK